MGKVLHGREMEVCVLFGPEQPSFPRRQHASSFQRIAPLFKTKMDRLGINWEGQTLIGIVSVLRQDEGGIGKSIPDARKISRDPILRVEGNLEGIVDGFPNTSRVLVEYGQSLNINFSTGSGSENPSLWTGKDWQC